AGLADTSCATTSAMAGAASHVPGRSDMLHLPKAREEGLIIEPLGDELLVYDTRSHRSNALNATAALVWRHCDGKTSLPELARLLVAELGAPEDEALVLLALKRLATVKLLEENRLPEGAEKVTRRSVARRLALAGGMTALLPLVLSIVAPTAAEAATCITALACLARLGPDGCLNTTCCTPGRGPARR